MFLLNWVPEGLVVLEPLGAEVADEVPDLGVALHVMLELVSAVGRLSARHAPGGQQKLMLCRRSESQNSFT